MCCLVNKWSFLILCTFLWAFGCSVTDFLGAIHTLKNLDLICYLKCVFVVPSFLLYSLPSSLPLFLYFF